MLVAPSFPRRTVGFRTGAPLSWALLFTCVFALGVSACANRGMEAPGELGDTGGSPGIGGTGGKGTGGMLGSTGGHGGTGGTIGTGGAGATGGTGTGGVGTGGITGTGGIGTGGTPGTGGVATGGITGTGGVATGGTPGTGGVATGGITGTGGVATGGTPGTGGVATGGITGTGGVATGGITGTGGVATGGTPGTGGATGTGGAAGHGGSGGAGGSAGAGGNVCPLGGVLDCSSTGALKLPDDLVADFSTPEWNSTSGKWCDADGLRGSVFSYSGASPSAATAAVDTTAQNLKLNLTVGAMGYAGGGMTFDSCVNASGFTSVQFTATITAGSLTGCAWQVQLQTQDQRPSSATSPSGGTCNPDAGASCYQFPAVTGLAVPTATATTYTEPFTAFSNPTSSAIPTRSQVIGIQWQVNSAASGTGTCTVELRVDNIKFQ